MAVTLKANATYGVRTAEFNRVTRQNYLLGGILVITEKVSETSKKVEISRFALQELETNPWGIRIQLTKPSGKDQYFVFLSTDSQYPDACTCDGHTAHGRCKHADSLRLLLTADELPLLHRVPPPKRDWRGVEADFA